MNNRAAGKYGIHIWGWPTLILFVLEWLLFAAFKLTCPNPSEYFLEPDSGREILWTTLLGCLFVSYLWVLVHRYSRLSEKKLSRITIGGVIFLTIMFVLGMISGVFLYLRQ